MDAVRNYVTLFFPKDSIEHWGELAVLVRCPKWSDYDGYSFWVQRSFLYDAKGRPDMLAANFPADKDFYVTRRERSPQTGRWETVEKIAVKLEELGEIFK